ncbi:MAG: hypothetical protein MUF58_16715 [Arcicella sp.]|jgi:hypothetical protein|nr:hypothetical protein [Arcicella sp.]
MLPTVIDKAQLADDFGYTLKTLAKRIIPVLGVEYYKSIRKFCFADLIKIFTVEGCPPKYDEDWIRYKLAHHIKSCGGVYLGIFSSIF